jgi:hypothetical protein
MVDIDKIEKRTVRSFYEDGLFEIALGLALLILGGYFFAQAVVPEDSALGSVLSVLFIFVIFFAIFFVNRLLRFLKRRITYPRTGFVAFKRKDPSPKRRVAAAVAGGLMGASLAALYGLSPSVRTLLPALNGLLFAVAVFLIANKIGLVRYFILAAASAVIGFAVTAARIGDIKGVGLYYGLFGVAALVSGLATLVVYLRRSPRPGAAGPEGPDAH